MGGDTKHRRLHVLHRELLFWDCIHFVLRRATDTGHMTRLHKGRRLSQGALTSRNDAVDDWRRTSVLCESWNTATRFPLSTATLRHKKLRTRTQKRLRAPFFPPLKCKEDTHRHQRCVALPKQSATESPVGAAVDVDSCCHPTVRLLTQQYVDVLDGVLLAGVLHHQGIRTRARHAQTELEHLRHGKSNKHASSHLNKPWWKEKQM